MGCIYIYGFLFCFFFLAALGSSLRHVGSFIVARGLFVAARRLVSGCGAQAPERVSSVVAAHGLSSCGVWAPEHAGSVVGARGLSCPTACGILVPQLEGGFFFFLIDLFILFI